jgi:aspartyl-tRNA synthetase
MILSISDMVGQEVELFGWVDTRRDMGKISFIDLRDRSAIAQVVLVPSELDEASQALLKDLRAEFCLSIKGIVNARGAKQVNPNMPTGSVEVLAKSVTVLNEAKTPPFALDNTAGINEEVRLKYRYLDLRSQRMLKNLSFAR